MIYLPSCHDIILLYFSPLSSFAVQAEKEHRILVGRCASNEWVSPCPKSLAPESLYSYGVLGNAAVATFNLCICYILDAPGGLCDIVCDMQRE